MKTVSLVVTEYFETCKSKSKSTQKRRRIVINRLMEQVGPKAYISALDAYHIDLTINASREKRIKRDGTADYRTGCAKSTLNAYRSDLRHFGNWLVIRGYKKSNPAAHVENEKTSTPKFKRRPLSRDQAAKLIEIAWADHPRDGMTALLMLSTGMRESEVIGLTWGNLNYSRSKAEAYRPKIGDQHDAFFTDELDGELAKWKIYFEERHGPVQSDWYIVPALAHKGERPGHFRMDPSWPMVPTNMQNSVGVRVKAWLAAVGEEDLRGKGSHTLRRTAGNLLMDEDGFDIRDVQTFFGHNSVQQTEQYLDRNQAKEKLSRKLRGIQFRGITRKGE